jgi:hypothetical protein
MKKLLVKSSEEGDYGDSGKIHEKIFPNFHD